MSDRPVVRLTGQQVKFIRKVLGESQTEFALRLDVSQPVIARFETTKLAEEIAGPENIIIRQIAEQNNIPLPKPDEAWAAFSKRAAKAIAKKAEADADQTQSENSHNQN